MKSKLITIFEHDYLVAETDRTFVDANVKAIPQPNFDALSNFVKDINAKTDNEQHIESWLLKPARKNKQDALKAAQYVGVIQFADGTLVEILPKLYRPQNDSFENTDNQIKAARQLLLDMLKTLKDARFKNFNSANLLAKEMHLLEIFVTMFLDELDAVIKQGIRSKYILQENNLNYFKGKLLVSQNICKNHGLLHKSYMQYEDYLPNIPENRLIKSTLVYLQKMIARSSLQKRIREALFIFDDIPASVNYKQDYALSANKSRLFSHYQTTIEWCNVFLNQQSFVTQQGNNLVKALFFDMNKLFEAYVADYLRKHEQYKVVSTQHCEHYLIYDVNNNNSGRMRLKPDIKLTGYDDKIVIADTKWKMIGQDSDLSQADFYQMFAYYSKYNDHHDENKTVEIWLIYPKHNEITNKSLITRQYRFDNNRSDVVQNKIDLQIRFFDFKENQLVENT